MLGITIVFKDGRKAHFNKNVGMDRCEQAVGNIFKALKEKNEAPVKIIVKDGKKVKVFTDYE